MRDCPVCGTKDANAGWRMSYKIPDGWTLPGELTWCECLGCGMIYADNFNATQADYDRYYAEHYGTGLDYPANLRRLRHLACDIFRRDEVSEDTRIVDFGGGDGYLVRELKFYGLKNSATWNIGEAEPEPRSVDILVASHVLEHIYDMPAVMGAICRVMRPGGLVIAEVPDALAYSREILPPILDYHPLHINHFTPHTLNSLFDRHGFEFERCEWLEGMVNATNYRGFYRPECDVNTYTRAHFIVKTNMADRLKKLKAIKEPVIVWGLAGLAWHGLALAPWLKIAGFVDMDPNYRGAAIDGIPVLDHVESDAPIVVMVSNPERGADIVKSIRDMGYTNRVVVI